MAFVIRVNEFKAAEQLSVQERQYYGNIRCFALYADRLEIAGLLVGGEPDFAAVPIVQVLDPPIGRKIPIERGVGFKAIPEFVKSVQAFFRSEYRLVAYFEHMVEVIAGKPLGSIEEPDFRRGVIGGKAELENAAIGMGYPEQAVVFQRQDAAGFLYTRYFFP